MQIHGTKSHVHSDSVNVGAGDGLSRVRYQANNLADV